MPSSATAASFAASIFARPLPSSVRIEPDASKASRIFGAPRRGELRTAWALASEACATAARSPPPGPLPGLGAPSIPARPSAASDTHWPGGEATGEPRERHGSSAPTAGTRISTRGPASARPCGARQDEFHVDPAPPSAGTPPPPVEPPRTEPPPPLADCFSLAAHRFQHRLFNPLSAPYSFHRITCPRDRRPPSRRRRREPPPPPPVALHPPHGPRSRVAPLAPLRV